MAGPPDGNNNSSTPIDGSALQSLPLPGTAAQSGVLSSDPATIPASGIPSPPASSSNTPLASGSTPAVERTQAQAEAAAVLRNQTPDIFPSAEGREGPAPHYFTERVHQAYYHDVIVYIEGEDVSPFLHGTLSFSQGFGTDANSCSFDLDNAGHRFTITPENLKGEFRRASPSEQFGPIDYDETAKSNMYARKASSDYNPIDRDSGGRRFPLHLWGSIFHKYDAVRVWVHNPVTENDEWLPAFTGFIVSKPTSEDYINGSNKITVSCKDIRELMAQMRVNNNTMLTTVQAGGAATIPTNTGVVNPQDVIHGDPAAAAQFADSSNRSFSTGFFSDLIRGSQFENPWTSLTLPNLVAALTFLPAAELDTLISHSDAAAQEASTTRDAALAAQALNSPTPAQRRLQEAARALQPLYAKAVAATSGGAALTAAEAVTYSNLVAALIAGSAEVGDVDNILNGSFFVAHAAAHTQEADNNANAAAASNNPTTTDSADRAAGNNSGSGRIGRMRPGVFPWKGSLFNDPPRPYAIESSFPDGGNTTSSHSTDYYQKVAKHMQRWYSLCLFSTPRRHQESLLGLDVSPVAGPSDSAPDYSASNRRYWTEQEVRAAGLRTRREDAWHPTAQGVHFLSPGTSTPADMLWSQSSIASTAISQAPVWETRLSMLANACETADYRFWVNGAGDLVFEFAQYDFSPDDYGPWKNVLTLDHHLKNEQLDDEGGPIKTVVSVSGSVTGRSDITGAEVTTLNAIDRIGVWSPTLASRFGVSVASRTYPQIDNAHRLEQIASLEFQKLLATADKYGITLAFRPWLLPNRPIYNAYRSRYALIDGISWSYPVTAGTLAGHNAPTTKLVLNYTRSFDQLGVPRYITGGPANAMYFARPANAEAGQNSLVVAMSDRLSVFSNALYSVSQTGSPTQQQLNDLRDRYRAIVPQGQNSYNVISSLLLSSGSQAPGEEDPRVTALRNIESGIAEITQHPGAFTEQELQTRIQDLRSQSEDLQRSIAEHTPNGSYHDQTSAGLRPVFGLSGVRSTLSQSSYEHERNAGGDLTCRDDPNSGGAPRPPSTEDPDMFGSPLGPASRTQIVRPRRGGRRSRAHSASSRGQVRVEDIPPSTGVWEFAGGFPRFARGVYDLRGDQWHRGVDIYTDPGVNVYSVADGIVLKRNDQFAPTPRSGPFAGQRRLDPQTALYILHKQGYVTVYRHLSPSSIPPGVTVGAQVQRGMVIGKVGLSGAERNHKPTHLHFETGAIIGSPVFNAWVGDDKRFRVISASDLRSFGANTRRKVEGLTIGNSTGNGSVTARDRGSMRVMYSAGLRGSIPESVASSLELDFLPHSNGTFRLSSNLLLTWSPSPTAYPFSRADNVRGPYGPRGSDKTLLTLREYFNRFMTKGIPVLNVLARPAERTPVHVPPLVTSGSARAISAASRRRRRAENINARIVESTQAHRVKYDAQVSLFSSSVPPNG